MELVGVRVLRVLNVLGVTGCPRHLLSAQGFMLVGRLGLSRVHGLMVLIYDFKVLIVFNWLLLLRLHFVVLGVFFVSLLEILHHDLQLV